jgi:Spy/CpxP family protein refolding chaperone
VSVWKVILATLVIFVAGVFTGGFLVKRTQPPPAIPAPMTAVVAPAPQTTNNVFVTTPGPWSAQRAELIRKMDRNLMLSREQRQKIEKIMRESHERTRPLFEKINPELREEMKGVREKIRAELTAEQQGKFDSLMRTPAFGAMEERLKQERKRRATNLPPHETAQ